MPGSSPFSVIFVANAFAALGVDHNCHEILRSRTHAGGRKSSAAFCWIKPGTGKFVVNRLPYTEYFSEWRMRELMTQPLTLTGTIMQFDVFAYTLGGGKVGREEYFFFLTLF